MARKDAGPKRSRREIALTVIFKIFGARFVEHGVRLVPKEALEWFIKNAPAKATEWLMGDDNQDTLAAVGAALAEQFGMTESGAAVVETLIKESVEEAGKMIGELGGGDAEYETYMEGAVNRRIHKIEEEKAMKKQATESKFSFTQRLADPTLDQTQVKRFDDRLAHQPTAERARYFTLMGEAVAELNEVKRLLAIDDDHTFFDHFDDFLRRAPKTSEKPKSFFERMASRAGDFADPDGPKMQDAKQRMEDFSTRQKATADRLAHMRRGR